MLGTLDFTGSGHWAPYNFSYCTALTQKYDYPHLESLLPLVRPTASTEELAPGVCCPELAAAPAATTGAIVPKTTPAAAVPALVTVGTSLDAVEAPMVGVARSLLTWE